MKVLIVALMVTSSLWAQKLDVPANDDLVAARAANKEMRYADAEALMQKDTAASPHSSLMWIELGVAELGLKKYLEAEEAYKRALGIDPETQKAVHQEDFYSSKDSATHATRNTAEHVVVSENKLNPEIVGKAYSDLGEIYARTKRVAESEGAWDAAVKANPAKASLYRSNETIIFYQTGDAEAQVKAADEAIAADPKRALPYYFKGQGLASKSTVDPKTQKLLPPTGCIEAYQKYLELEPKGQFSSEAKEMLAAAGQPAGRSGK
jgi:tetratricopeptide (TPR) repeat protein